MNGFHGVNGTAAVTLIGELHALAAVVITGAQQGIGRLSNTESVPGDLENGGCEAVILSDVFYVGIFILIFTRCSWILERYILAISREI